MKLEDCNISSTQILSLLPPSALCLSCLWSIVMFFSTHHLLCPFCFVCIVHFTFSPLTVHHPTCHLPSHNLDFFSALCSITLAPNLSSVGRHSDFSSSTFTFPCPSRLRVTLFFFFFFLPHFWLLQLLVSPLVLSLSSPCFTSLLRSSFETSEVCIHLLGKCHVNLDKKAP